MSELYTYDATHLTTIRDGEVELTQSAHLGEVGRGQFVIDDTAGTQAIVGQKDFSVTQSLSSNAPIFRGYIGERSFSRGEYGPKVSAVRAIAVTVDDLNAMLGFLLIDGTDGKRPAETVAARGAWLMASDYVGFVDNGRCDFPADKGMDAADYRSQYAGDVLADMALAAGGYNYHVNDWGFGAELTFRDDNASTADTCTLRISNVLSDASSVTLNPASDATLERRPGNVYSKLAYSYAKGTQYEERAATATSFNGERGGTISNSNVKTAAKASDEATSMLWQHSTEEDFITCRIEDVSAANINLVLPGMRIQAKFSEFATEGYGEFTYFRIIERTVHPLAADGAIYELRLRLSPQEAAETFPAVNIVQSAFGRGSVAGTTVTFANPPTVGNKLLVIISDYDNSLPAGPNVSPTIDNWGTGAWTRLNSTTRSAVDARYNGTSEVYHGIAAYYKTVDSTNQTCHLPGTYVTGGAWELSSTADLASATVAYADVQTTSADPCVFNAGSLGTVASGELAFYGAVFCNNVNAGGAATGYAGDFLPMTTVTPGSFTERWYHGSHDGNYGPYSASYDHQTWIGDMEGDGSAVSASIQKPRNERNGFTWGAVGWAGIGIKVPPL